MKSKRKTIFELTERVKLQRSLFKKQFKYFGVSYDRRDFVWSACRRSKKQNQLVHNGTYKYEDTAAHAGDTLARKLIANDKKGHKLNFPEDIDFSEQSCGDFENRS